MDIEQLEGLGLAEDRSSALAQLIPGTEDFYFYHCLNYQHRKQFDEADALLKNFVNRYGWTARAYEIFYRQSLLRYGEDPQKTLSTLKNALSLRFDHQREAKEDARRYPTALDPALLDREALTLSTQKRHGLSGFTDRALERLVPKLDDANRRALLTRLSRPDVPGLAALVLADLSSPGSGGFGSLPIHKKLLPEQLEELLRQNPSLRDNPAFLEARLQKIRPGEDEPWEHDDRARMAYLERLWEIAEPLSPVFNDLKAHILYHILDLTRRRGVYDRDLFLRYLALPRLAQYVHAEYLSQQPGGAVFRLGQKQYATGLPLIRDDEGLVREYLSALLVTAENYEAFQPYVREEYLREIFATTKILAGEGDQERWYSMLGDPARFQALKERVDIELTPQNPTYFRADEPVVLSVDIKNVSTLVVKVFEINARNYYLQHNREVDTSIDLDGLVASAETTYHYDEPPFRRVRRTFRFDDLARPGIFVVEFIGNGKSSRALICKGGLRYLERCGAAGHVFTILNEAGEVLPDASLWLGGREYRANEAGSIIVPYSTSPGRVSIILCHGDTATLAYFIHKAERYRFSVGIFVDREQLISRKTARVVLRPLLQLNDIPVSLSLIERPRLIIETIDRRGVRVQSEVGLSLSQDEEATHTFRVPEDLASITFTVKGAVQSITTPGEIELEDSAHFSLNGIDKKDAIEDLHLAFCQEGYVLYLLGKTGEPRPAAPLYLSLYHEDFTNPIETTLETDEEGRATLGMLEGVQSLSVLTGRGLKKRWKILRDECRYPASVHAAATEVISLPYVGRFSQITREGFSLLERRGNTYTRDCFQALRLSEGRLSIEGLWPGDYELHLKEYDTKIAIFITAGVLCEGWVVGPRRMLEARAPMQLSMPGVSLSEEALVVRLDGFSESTRVHVVASRFLCERSLLGALGQTPWPEGRRGEVVRSSSLYLSGRDIGDEYRYILERKQKKKYPGNPLTRPGLLLNPWAVRATTTGRDFAAEGSAYAASAPPAAEPVPAAQPGPSLWDAEDVGFSNLDFLPETSVVFANLRPDEEGVLRIAREQLGDANVVRVLAVDEVGAVERWVGLPESLGEPRDLRLREGVLDPEKRFTEQKQISLLGAGQRLVLDDITTASLARYDTLGDVYRLLLSISGDKTLENFSFILDWPVLDVAEKRALYSEYACHELHLFLYEKDRAFFDEVVAPYLRNKKHKTFLDRYLLGDDLSEYTRPWAFGRLNVVEQILLSRRLAEKEPIARLIQDRFDLSPSDPASDERLFGAALNNGALGGADTFSLAQEKARADLRALNDKIEETQRKKNLLLARQKRTETRKTIQEAMHGLGDGSAFDVFDRMEQKTNRLSAESEITGELSAGYDDASAEERFAQLQATGGADEALAALGAKMGLAPAVPPRPGAAPPGQPAPPAPRPGAARRAEQQSDLRAREGVRRLFRAVDKTREWAENNYYKRRIQEQGPGLIPVNAFWRDFAAHDPKEPFVSKNFAAASSNFTEMMCALAVLDLPFTAREHEVSYEGARMSFCAAGDVVIFHKEIKPAPLASAPPPVLVSQNYLRRDDRYRYEGNERLEKYVKGDALLTHVVYTCQVVLTNPTSSPQTLTVLLQIPQGALPVADGFYTRSQNQRLAGYATETIEYSFYFPAPGEFSHFPVNVSIREECVAAAKPEMLKVSRQESQIDRTSWEYLSQHGEPSEVLDYLAQANLARVNLEKIAWRMGDPDFYREVIALLSRRYTYHRTLWSYGVLHNDAAAIREFLLHEETFLRSCGLSLRSPLLDIDPVARGWYEHLEYSPLVNARAHRLKAQTQILNPALEEQYRKFLSILCYQPAPTQEQLLSATYYLLLQDRIEDAIKTFARIDPDAVVEKLPYDYVRLYLAFYQEEHDLAHEIASSYASYPVDTWRKRFESALAMLEEAKGSGSRVVGPRDRAQEQAHLASTEPGLEFSLQGDAILLRYQNLRACRVNYYLMDIELLFSRQPFVQQGSERFSLIKPNRTETVSLPEERTEISLSLPTEVRGRNIVIEITAEGIRKAQAHYAHDLSVQIIEPYGQVRVCRQSDGSPLSRCYVKAYARNKTSGVEFYKDGYTDLRGLFDYASLSTNALDHVERFALLIMSDEHGATIREAAPPPR